MKPLELIAFIFMCVMFALVLGVSVLESLSKPRGGRRNPPMPRLAKPRKAAPRRRV